MRKQSGQASTFRIGEKETEDILGVRDTEVMGQEFQEAVTDVRIALGWTVRWSERQLF